MVKSSSESAISRRFVLAFLDFLNSVELSPGADSEALEVARDCLQDAFGLNSAPTDELVPPGLLLDLFRSWEEGQQNKSKPEPGSDPVQEEASCSSSSTSNSQHIELNEASAEESYDLGVASRDELFGRFYAALDKINFFKVSASGFEDPVQTAKATKLFSEALAEVERTEKKSTTLKELAEFFKSKGNQAVQSRKYSDAIELYSCAIALCDKNAVYYCNRAAAYTQQHKYNEAIEDCLKSIQIDPNYSKAYSRLGSAYFSQGNYHDALYKGYLKASQLDPNNTTIQENIQVTKMKLAEQNAQTHAAGPTNNNNNNSAFPSFSFGNSASPEFITDIMRGISVNLGPQSTNPSSPPSFPVDLTGILSGLGSNPNQTGPTGQTGQAHDSSYTQSSGNNEGEFNTNNANNNNNNHDNNNHSGVRLDANVELNMEQIRSMMLMLSSQMGPHDSTSHQGSDHT